MGKRGPQPTATVKLSQRGSWRAKVRKGEPMPTLRNCSIPPDYLDMAAKHEWDDIYPKLKNCGIVTEIDENALSRYCFWWAKWKWLIQNEPDNIPAISKADDHLLKLGARFGLTPSERTAIKVDNSSDKNKERYFKVS